MTTVHQKYVSAQRELNSVPIGIDPRRTALLIVDMQSYYFDPESAFSQVMDGRAPGLGEYFRDRAQTVVEPNLRRMLEAFRDLGQRVLFTTHASESPDGTDWPPTFRRMNEEALRQLGKVALPARTAAEARIIDALSPVAGEIVFNKTTYSAFASTGLDASLRNTGIDTLVIGGVVTNRCVETTVRDAADRGFRVILAEDGTGGYSQETQDAAILSLQGAYAFVRSTDDVLRLLREGSR